MTYQFFPNIKKVTFSEDHKQPGLCFRHYQPDQQVCGKKMKDQLKFSMAYWHTLGGGGKDMFGDDTFERPWNQEPDPLKRAELKVYAGFELMQKLGIEYFCFHDRDIARKGDRSTKRIKTLTRSSP